MKTTVFFSGALRSVPMICLLAGGILAASPAFAAEGETTRPATARQDSRRDALLAEVAERVREKALFSAETAPRVARLLEQAGDGYYRRNDAEMLIDVLWQLKSAPALQQEWLARMSAPGLSALERERAIREFASFVRETERFMRGTRTRGTGNLWTTLRGLFGPLLSGENPDDPDVRALVELERKLASEKAREESFAQALVMSEFARKYELTSYEAAEYGPLLLRVADEPEDMTRAVSVIRNRVIPDDRRYALLRNLADNPDAARKEIDNLEASMKAEARYRFAVFEESGVSFILLPLAAIVPGAEKALEACGSLPLSASAAGRTEKTLTVKRHERALPERASLVSAKGALTPPPFVGKGERLYLVAPETEGTPVFAGTPLDVLAFIGPRILELTDKTADTFSRYLSSQLSEGEYPGRAYFVTAVCGPEELAAHLASLSVMLSERETSLFGAVGAEEGELRSRAASYYGRQLGGELPLDTPGETLRMVQLDDVALFTVLAPLADKKGLARLMGPIRGVWTRGNCWNQPEPWTEVRYDGKGDSGILGASPVLRLGKPVLEALVADQERMIILSWVDYRQRSKERAKGERIPLDQHRKEFPELLASIEKEFADLRAKGFTSPTGISEALYYLDEFGKPERMGEGEDKLAAMRAVIDDTSRTPAERLEALREIAFK